MLWIAMVTAVSPIVITFPWGKESPLPLLQRLLLLGAAVAIPIWLGRRRKSLLAAWLVTYIVTYGVLSSRGAYIGSNHGGDDNRTTWYPAYCDEVYQARSGRQKSTLRPLGWFFLPLVLIDRTLIHRTNFEAW